MNFNTVVPEPKMQTINVKSLNPIVTKGPDAKLFGVPIKKRETHINRSDSFTSKFIRYVRADEYTTYDTKWSKGMIICSILTGVFGLILVITFLYYYFNKGGISSLYVLNSIQDEEFRQKNSELDLLNRINLVNLTAGGAIGITSLIFSALHWKYMFTRNTFRNESTGMNENQ